MKPTQSSSSIQWDVTSRGIFERVISGTSWLSRSHFVRGEKQPLIQKREGEGFALHNRLGGRGGGRGGGAGGGRGVPPLYATGQVSHLWPPAFHSHQLPLQVDTQRSVCISDICRTATPLLPPIKAEKEGVSWVGACFLLINAALGIGILNFPAAFNQAGGILSATVIQMVMVTLMILTMLILAYCSDVNHDVTYHDVLLSMCGSRAQKLAAVSITCTCYGVGIAVIIIIGDQFDRLFLSIFGPTFCHYWYLDRQFTIPAVTICLVLPMCYCKRVDFLRYAGSLGIFAMLYPVFLTAYGYFKLDIKPATIKTEPDDLAQLCAVIPVLCLAYQCQEVVVPVYACMKERTLRNFTKSCVVSMTLLLVLYSIVGCFGYLTFGSVVQANVMKMYDASDPIVMVGGGALIIKMIVTYPVLALCGRGAVDGLYSEIRGLSAADFMNGEKKRRFIIASIWLGSSLVIAVSTSSIGKVINLLSSITSINIFVYPGICLISVVLKKDSDLIRWKSRFLVAGAILLAAVGTFCFGIVLSSVLLGRSNSPPPEILCAR